MRIIFDMDGTIAEGPYISEPDMLGKYMKLAPYDPDTMEVLFKLCRDHDVFIMTARSFRGATKFTKLWLDRECEYPLELAGIITGIHGPEKVQLAQHMKAHVIFDDSPEVYLSQIPDGPTVFLMDNPAWDWNQQVDYPLNRVKSWKQIYNIVKDLNATINN